MAANNETGVIQPIETVAELCRAYNVACHSDMAQYLGKAPIDLNQMKLNFASFSAHKLGGPSGVGALYCRSGQQLVSLLRGGGQEQGRRAGTENLHGIIGFGAAVAAHDIANINVQASWRDTMEADIQKACPEIEVMGSDAPRLANTSALYLPQLSAQKAVMLLDLAGFAVSAGAACSSGKVKNSHVITAMARGDAAANVIRISAGWQSTKAEWTGVAKAIIEIYKAQH
jgi:cysteine desulfurase